MISKSVYKIPEGKLVKICLEHDNKKINAVKISGDFFLYPENGLEAIENSLKGKKLSKECIVREVNEVIKKNSLELFGLSAEGIADAILKCLKGNECTGD
jgi:lipoate-protein ligase A